MPPAHSLVSFAQLRAALTKGKTMLTSIMQNNDLANVMLNQEQANDRKESSDFHGILESQEFTTLAESARVTNDIISKVKSLDDSSAMSERLEQETADVVDLLLREIRAGGLTASKHASIRYFLVGNVLLITKRTFNNHREFMRFKRAYFVPSYSLEALRQAVRVARLGGYFVRFAMLSKNNLLELYYAINKMSDVQRNEDGMIISPRFNALLDLIPERSMELIDVGDSGAFRRILDELITIYRLENAGISTEVFTHDQARLISLYRGKAIETEDAKSIADKLDAISEAERPSFFDTWVMDKLFIPSAEGASRSPNRRLDSSAATLGILCDKYLTNQMLMQELLDDPNARTTVIEAHQKFTSVVDKLQEEEEVAEASPICIPFTEEGI
jgi:hypothetical protein